MKFLIPSPTSSIVAFCGLLLAGEVHAQVPTKCLEIESVLVDACNSACADAQEGENEMFRFVAGPDAISLTDIDVQWATPNAFLGWVQNGTTASLTTQLNATITNCGRLIEPTGGIIPAGKRVLGITSTDMCIAGNSFAGLSDTLYVIYQAPGNTFGHFKNTNNGDGINNTPSGTQSFRTFILFVVSIQCSDSVTYNLPQLVNQLGTYGGSPPQNDGSSLSISWPGASVVSYFNDGCQAPVTSFSATITSDVEPMPCGASTLLNATTVGNVASVFWSGGSGTFSNNSGNTTTYTLGPTEITSTLLAFCAVSACGDTVCDQIELWVQGALDLVITPNGPTDICSGSTVELTASGGAAYTWNTGAQTAAITAGTSGIYIVTTSNSCGSISDTIEVSVTNAPVALLDGPTTACATQVLHLIASGGTSYAWSTGATTAELDVTGPGSYAVIVTDVCGSDDATITVLPGEALQPTFTATDTEGCAPQCATFQAQDLGIVEYAWTFGHGATALGASVAHCFPTGDHDVALTASPLGDDPRCPGTVMQAGLVLAWPLPAARFSIDPAVVTIEDPTVRFNNASTDASSWLWHFDAFNDSTSTERSPVLRYDAVDCYTIMLEATSDKGCTASATHELCVEDPFAMYVPNAFTPNNDGINDGFQAIPTTRDPKVFQLDIYDRWGVVVFSGSSPRTAWTGDGVPDGVYVWKLRLQDAIGKMYERSGHVALIR